MVRFRLLISPAVILLLAGTFACDSRPVAQGLRNSRDVVATTSPASVINLQCDAERIRNAPRPFHWSYKKISPPLTNTDWEADVTPFSIAGAVTDGSGRHVIHGLRSDSTSWNTVVSILTSALPDSTLALVNNSSAMLRAGKEMVNGVEATKYAIDATRNTSGDASLIHSLLGANGVIKGTAWVNGQGCPIKFVLDVEQYYSDGTMHKEHYEASATER